MHVGKFAARSIVSQDAPTPVDREWLAGIDRLGLASRLSVQPLTHAMCDSAWHRRTYPGTVPAACEAQLIPIGLNGFPPALRQCWYAARSLLRHR